MRDARVDSLIAEDLAALRSYSPPYDAARGAERLALASAALTIGSVGAGLGTGGLSGVSKSAAWSVALKLIGLFVSTGSVALVALSPIELRGPTPQEADLAVAAECIATSGPARSVETPRLPQPSSTPAPEPLTAPTTGVPSASTIVTTPASRALPSKNGDFERDLAALERAKAFARSNPALALESPIPPGRFVEEHEIVAIRALVSMNRRDEALARIERFLSEHPKSAFSDTVRGLRGAASAKAIDPLKSSPESPIVQ